MAATMNYRGPRGRVGERKNASTESGSMTSCTQRGTTTGAPGGVAGPGGAGVSRCGHPLRQICPVPEAIASILFIGDIVGSLGRHTLLGLLPCCASATRRPSSSSTAKTRRPRHHAEDRRRAVRRRRRRHHARQPRLPPARDLRLPRLARADPAALQLPAQPARSRVCVVERDGVRLGVVNLSGTSSCAPAPRPSPTSTRRSASSRAASTT